MNAKTPQPASITRVTSACTDHIDEELQRYDAYLCDLRGLLPGSRYFQTASSRCAAVACGRTGRSPNPFQCIPICFGAASAIATFAVTPSIP